MSESGSSASRKRSWATTRFAADASTSVPRKTIRSRRSREKMSKDRSWRPSDSTTMGTRWFDTLLIGCTLHATHRLQVEANGGTMEVEREIVVPESPTEVWEALTEPERLEEWFASEVELDARPGGEGVFRWGDGDERRAVVRELEEGERLVLDWDDGGSVVVELRPVVEGTRVHVVESSPEFALALELRALALAASAAKPPTLGGKTAPPEAALACTARAAA